MKRVCANDFLFVFFFFRAILPRRVRRSHSNWMERGKGRAVSSVRRQE
jgi:hypothetical protein